MRIGAKCCALYGEEKMPINTTIPSHDRLIGFPLTLSPVGKQISEFI